MARIINRIASGYEYNGQHVARLDSYAKNEGLTSQQMTVLLSEIDNSSVYLEIKLKLMKCLIPRDKICEEIFIEMTRILISCTTNAKLKVEVLNWMAAAYPFMAVSSGRFAFLYETFLTLLPFQELRKFLCHLLYVSTTKHSVTRRGIALVSRTIMNIVGNYPRLIRILQLYYELCPEYFDGKFAATKFEFTNESLGDYFTRMQSRVQLNAINKQFYLTLRSMRLCSMDLEDIDSDEDESDEPLHIKSFNQFYQVLTSLEKKRDIKAILEDETFSIFLTTNISENNRLIVQDYILTYLYRNADSSLHLNIILDIFHKLQFGVPRISDVVKKLHSKTWNRESDLITKFIQYEPLCCFETILPNLQIVCEYMLQFGVNVQCKLINLLSNLYVNWMLTACEDVEFFCNCKSFFLDESSPNGHEIGKEIVKLGGAIDDVCKELISRNDHPYLLNEVLLHYMRMSFIHQNMDSGMFIRFLPYEIFIRAVFSNNICTLDSLCYLMLCYQKEVDHMIAVNHSEYKNAKKHYVFYKGELSTLLLGSYVNGKKHSMWVDILEKSNLNVPNLEKRCVLYKLPSVLWHTKTFPHKKLLANFKRQKELRKKFYKHIHKDGFYNLYKLLSDLEKKI